MRRLNQRYWPHRVEIRSQINMAQILRGMDYGTIGQDWTKIDHSQGTDFYFRNQGDATMFALRWS